MELLKLFDSKNNTLGVSTLEGLLANENDSLRLLPKSILPTDDGLYQLKYGTVFPVAHPALSTQPSVLPQSFGNLDIMEVLIANGRESEIPSGAIVIMATSFNDDNCCAAICKKVDGAWTITNSEGFTPDFTLVQYVQVNGSGYYGSGGGSNVKRDGTKDFEIAMNYDKLPQSKRYLAITADSTNTENAKVSWSGKGTLFMSKNLLIWEPFNADNSLAAGETLYLSGQVNKAGTIKCNQPHDVSGNPMSLYYLYDFDVQALNGHYFENLFLNDYTLANAKNLSLPATSLAEYCYNGMFYGCTSLTTAPELPATTLVDYCYQNMFQDCTSLTSAPKLPATTLAAYCYQSMFANCTSLTVAPELPATSLEDSCYNGMFQGCTSLTTAPELPATTLARFCYGYMFVGCTSLATAPELPATTLVDYCYQNMFQGCSSLTTAPKLPATTLAQSCYQGMFQGCTSLATAPELPAMTLAVNCYAYMFKDCTSLATAPELPAMTLAANCYAYMFKDCTSLITAPELPATTLVQYCYQNMFQGCSSLTTAPELPATTLAKSCYDNMFNGCTNLNNITCLATDISASWCLSNWVSGVASTGTFTKAASMTKWPSGRNGIPAGWTVRDAS